MIGLFQKVQLKFKSSYKAWSKAGVGTGYGISNHQEYISGINWVTIGLKYFFTKVSDYILVVLFISQYLYILEKKIP